MRCLNFLKVNIRRHIDTHKSLYITIKETLHVGENPIECKRHCGRPQRSECLFSVVIEMVKRFNIVAVLLCPFAFKHIKLGCGACCMIGPYDQFMFVLRLSPSAKEAAWCVRGMHTSLTTSDIDLACAAKTFAAKVLTRRSDPPTHPTLDVHIEQAIYEFGPNTNKTPLPRSLSIEKHEPSIRYTLNHTRNIKPTRRVQQNVGVVIACA